MSAQTQNPSIRQLIADVKRDATNLLAYQQELAKTEIKATQKDAQTTSAAFAVAAGAGVMGGVFLLVTLAYVLVALGLPTWAGFGIVALLLLLIAGIAGAVGAKKAKKLKGVAPQAKRELAATRRALSGKAPATDLVVAPSLIPEQRRE